ncbi:hypothetical protein BKA65DRAFT_543536 [Rhexocercosporidium sp. MPI-PUGE-AT-0058]|nr:hypothetical protein BKA65DRAFT_543536 [Rhexocercosporidium sp. MPI-PUGE-AT-0058]
MAVNFFAMPSSPLLLLFSFAFSLTNALPWAGAQQTNVYREAAWSPAPTALPKVPANIFKRESVDVNICGWIGGSFGAPALCSAGSSCIHDTIHAVVGCCTTDGPCTAGVYTSCVDKNSLGWAPNEGMQNNGIYSCSGDAVCYRNTYPGGYYQYGCGASQDATSVETTYKGQASNMLLQVVFTGVNFSPFSAEASTTSSAPRSSATSSSSSSLVSSSSSSSISSVSSSSISSSSSMSTSTLSSSKSQTSTGTSTLAVAGKATPASESSSSSATAKASKKSENKGAIAGAVIGAVLGLAAIVGFALWWGRRRQNKRNDQRAGSFITQHHKGTPPTSGPFQRIAPYGPDDFGAMSQNRTVTTVTANDSGANTTGVFPTQYSNAYASLPSQSSPPLTPPQPRATHPGSEPGTFQAMYLPPPTASTPLVSQSEIDDFSRGYNDALPSQGRDTHIHTGDMPSTAETTVPMLLRGGSGGSSAARSRSQNWGVTTEALRAQRPRIASGPVPIKPAGWSPRGLSMRGSTSPNSFSGTGSAARGRTEERNEDGSGSPEWAVPPRSPLRSERTRESDGLQRYQLVDEVVGDDVPILHSPGLRQGRGGGRRESIKE